MESNHTLWDKLMTMATILIAIASVITAYQSVQSTKETRRLVESQIKPDILFDVYTKLLPAVYSAEKQIIGYQLFSSEPSIMIEIINKGTKAIKVKDVVVKGDCINSPAIQLLSNLIIEPQKSNISIVNIYTSFLKENPQLPCDLVFNLRTDSIEKEDKIVLEKDEKITGKVFMYRELERIGARLVMLNTLIENRSYIPPQELKDIAEELKEINKDLGTLEHSYSISKK